MSKNKGCMYLWWHGFRAPRWFVSASVRALFHSALHWMSFINLPRFFDSLLNPTKRVNMQPSLVIAALAVGRFAQSSEAEQGPRGRAKALKLLDLAHSSLQGSLASGWVDIGLIQAAWVRPNYACAVLH